MLTTSPRRRAFHPSIISLDLRVMPTVTLPPGGCVPMIPITEVVNIDPPSSPDRNPSNDLTSTISLVDF